MTIETLGNIGEFVAAIGTIATLFYLAMQIRRSSEATRASSQQSLLDTGSDATFELGQNVELARIVGAGLLDFDSLDDRDKTSFSFLIQRYVGNLEKGLRLRKAGLIDRETLDSVGDGLLLVIRSRGGASWWQSYRGSAPIVADYLDRRIAALPENQITWDEVWPYWARWVSKDLASGESTAKNRE